MAKVSNHYGPKNSSMVQRILPIVLAEQRSGHSSCHPSSDFAFIDGVGRSVDPANYKMALDAQWILQTILWNASHQQLCSVQGSGIETTKKLP
ncbi:hypothetical protein QE152_g8012 [Popillia japonica]|uniref:Uncharacterized protein n=1 Tax=Popillia japonica TaxID=7064 RepID=A0AAW1MDD5_POPJA